jgi:hypothetical protein
MNHEFFLTPDATLLERCGYLTQYSAQLLRAELLQNGIIKVEIDTVWRHEQLVELEKRFTHMLITFGLSEHYQSLFYVCLLESNLAEMRYQHAFETYNHRLRDKQLAQFLLMFQPDAKYPPISLKISSLTETVKITSEEIIGWCGSLMKQFLELGEFVPGEHGASLFSFIANAQGNLDNDSELNYDVIKNLAHKTVRRPGIRDRNRFLASFLLVVWNVLNKGTAISAPEGTRFSDKQIKFLFEVAETFGWLSGISLDSEPKDYIYTLLSNHMKVK